MAKKQESSQREPSEYLHSRVDIFDKLPQAVLRSFWFDYSHDLIALIDLEENVMMVNRACAEALGGEPEDFIGLSLSTVLQDEHSEDRSREVVQVIETGEGFSRERAITLGEKKRWLRSIIEPVKDAEGRVEAVFVMAVDITETKMAEQEVEQLDGYYQALFQNTLEGICIVSDEGYIIDANPKMLSLTRLEKEELCRKPIKEFIEDVNQHPLIDKYWELLRKQGYVSGSWEIAPDTDYKRDVEFYAIANIMPGQHLVVLNDITARKRAELELIASEERYSHLVEQLPSSILVVQDGKYVFANPAAATALGYERVQDVVGTKFISSISKKSTNLVQKRVNRATGGLRNEFRLLEVVWPDGTHRMIESMSVPYTYEGRPAILVMGYDVTRREFTASRLSSFYQVAPIGAGVIVDRRFVEVNRQFCEMTGYSVDELVGVSSEKLYFSKEEYERVGREKQKQIREYGQSTVETCFRRKDGEIVHVVLSSMPFVSTDPSQGLSVTALDITQLKQAEEALQELNEQLEDRVVQRTAELAQRTLDLESFSYAISHDLRAPLRAINGFSQILMNEHVPESDQEAKLMFNSILAAGKRMDLVIEGMLLLAELGQQSLRPVPLDLGQFAEKIYREISVDLVHRRIEADFQRGSSVWADPALMELALSHLLTNAVRFSSIRKQAKITFGYREDKRGELTFYLKDNGIGFDPGLADKLFVPFQRLEENEELEGLGVGLAVVKKVIERHHGEIWAESEKDQGTTFFFRLRVNPDTVNQQ